MRTWIRSLVVAGALAVVPTTLAQTTLFWKYLQRWTPPRASHESRVRSCAQPTPLNIIAADDWICGANGPLVRVHWWGNLAAPAQGKRPYYIAIYLNNPATCQPVFTNPVYTTCVTPDFVRYVGMDCTQRRVYHLSAVFPTPFFNQIQGTHYWVQISEADQESIRPNLEDFRWSAHRPVNFCPAVQAPPMTQPIRDLCDQQVNDLAFGFSSRDVSGVIVPPPGIAKLPAIELNLIDPQTGELRETLPVDVDDEGSFTVNPESPDGVYIFELRGGCLPPLRRTGMLENGTCFSMSFFDVFYGDLDGDGAVGLGDLTLVLSNFGRSIP